MLDLQKSEKRLEIKWKTILFSILGIQLLLSLLLFDPKMDVGGDNAYYIHLAQRLFSFQGYTTAFEPGPPKAYSHHPFGFPLMLAPLAGVTGGNVLALKVFVMLLGLGATYLTFLVFRKETDSFLIPFLIALTVAVNSQVIEYSHWILSEVPFLFVSLLTILLFFKAESVEDDKTGKWSLLTILAMAFTIHMRTVGIVLPGAAIVYLGLNRRWKKIGWLALGIFMLVFPWIVRNRLLAADDTSYATQLFLKNNFDPSEGYVSLSDLFYRIGQNIKFYSTEAAAVFIRGTVAKLDERLSVKIISAALCTLSVAGLLIRLIRKRKLIDLYTLFYLGVVVIWPYTFRSVRFLIPACPFLFYYLYYFFKSVAGRLTGDKKLSSLIPVAVVVLLSLSGVITQAMKIPTNISMLGRYLSGDKYAGYILPWKHFFMAADWARKNTPENAVFAVRKPSLFYVHSGGRKVIEFPLTSDKQEMMDFLLSADFVLINSMFNSERLTVVHRTTGSFLIPAMQDNMKHFGLVYGTESPSTYIFMTSRDGFDKHMDADQFQSLFGNGREDYERAIEFFKGIIKDNPKDWNNYFKIAFFYQQIGETDKADQYYEEAFNHDPDDLEFVFQIGGYFYSQGKLDQAEMVFDKLLALNPNDTRVLIIKSKIRKDKEDYQQAIDLLKKVLEIEPDRTDVREDMVYVYVLADKLTEAENLCFQILEKDPNNLKANLGLGRIYIASPGTYEKALFYLQKTRELAPEKTQQLDENYIIPLQNAIEEMKKNNN